MLRERLFQCDHFALWRLRGEAPFTVGSVGAPRVLVCIDGAGQLEHDGVLYAVGKGDVMLLAGGGRSVSLSATRRLELVGSRDTGV